MIHEGGETLPDSEEFIETVMTQTNKANKLRDQKRFTERNTATSVYTFEVFLR